MSANRYGFLLENVLELNSGDVMVAQTCKYTQNNEFYSLKW